MQSATIKGIAHITGGGIHENLPRAIAAGLAAEIHSPEPFRLAAAPVLEKYVEREKLFHTFNMGTGLILIAEENQLPAIKQHYPNAAIMGRLVKGSGVALKL